MPRLSIRVENQQGLFIASTGEAAHRDLVGFGLSEDEAIGELIVLLARTRSPQPRDESASPSSPELQG